MNNFVTNALDTIITPVLDAIAKFVALLFSTRWSSIIIGFLLINIIGFILMKRDKQYAKEGKSRISELTLLSTAAVGGSLGIYGGMYKFNHKTLHKKFTILVPIIMLIQMSLLSFEIFSKLI